MIRSDRIEILGFFDPSLNNYVNSIKEIFCQFWWGRASIGKGLKRENYFGEKKKWDHEGEKSCGIRECVTCVLTLGCFATVHLLPPRSMSLLEGNSRKCFLMERIQLICSTDKVKGIWLLRHTEEVKRITSLNTKEVEVICKSFYFLLWGKNKSH